MVIACYCTLHSSQMCKVLVLSITRFASASYFVRNIVLPISSGLYSIATISGISFGKFISTHTPLFLEIEIFPTVIAHLLPFKAISKPVGIFQTSDIIIYGQKSILCPLFFSFISIRIVRMIVCSSHVTFPFHYVIDYDTPNVQ